MPYISDQGHTNEEARRVVRWFNFSEVELAQANSAMIWSSSFEDPGSDWNRAVLLWEDQIIAEKFEYGY